MLNEAKQGVSAVKLAERMKVNPVLMKEHIQVAEEKGFVCRDESYEGVLYFPNLIISL
jgi:ESCRT-II complex subunit VPS36